MTRQRIGENQEQLATQLTENPLRTTVSLQRCASNNLIMHSVHQRRLLRHRIRPLEGVY